MAYKNNICGDHRDTECPDLLWCVAMEKISVSEDELKRFKELHPDNDTYTCPHCGEYTP